MQEAKGVFWELFIINSLPTSDFQQANPFSFTSCPLICLYLFTADKTRENVAEIICSGTHKGIAIIVNITFNLKMHGYYKYCWCKVHHFQLILSTFS